MPPDNEAARLIEQIHSVGKYEVLEQFDEGASAFAFRAEHKVLGKAVFLKVYAGLPGDEDSMREPRILVEALRNSPEREHLVELYDAEWMGPYLLMAMQFVEGGSVFTRVCKGPMAVEDAREVIGGILRGLTALHTSGFVHRDIKPSNVMVEDTSGRPVSKITDFGSAARLPEAGGSVSASRHSPLYVPPEGWLEPSQFDVRSDVYQAGMVFAELLYGALPTREEDFLDSTARKELGRRKLCRLDSYERSKLVDRALSRQASKRGFLKHLRPCPYTRPALRLIKKATEPAREARYQSPSDMLLAMTHLSMPNWRQLEASELRADGWQKRDWKVLQVLPETWQVTSVRRGGARFGSPRNFETAEAACDFVNAFKT